MRRFSTKLLFQWVPSLPPKRRLCEERLVTFRAPSSRDALVRAKRLGKRGEFSYKEQGGGRGRFQFLGILDLMELGPEAGPHEVWWDIYERLEPYRRRAKLLPSEKRLRIFTDNGRRAV
jgi:uncharacterized protein DUF4288